jgi:hypothetical protein
MKQELDQLLCERYPKIFVERHLSEMETCMCWGFAHGEGWFNIIDQLCANIQSHIDWKEKQGHAVPQVVAEQVKEKFGTLRFYYRGGDDYVSGLVSMAESMTSVTCEECGAPGTTGGKGWISTLCETHRNKNG